MTDVEADHRASTRSLSLKNYEVPSQFAFKAPYCVCKNLTEMVDAVLAAPAI